MSASSSDDENVRVGVAEGLKLIEEKLIDAQTAVRKLMAVQRRVRSADEMGPELQAVLRKGLVSPRLYAKELLKLKRESLVSTELEVEEMRFSHCLKCNVLLFRP